MMIDYVELLLEGTFPPLGKKLSVAHRLGVVSESYTQDRYRMFGGGADFEVQIRQQGKAIFLGFCPAKILQGHNGFGSNDLVPLVYYAVCAIFKELEIAMASGIEDRLIAGAYELYEVHIAELHAMDHALIRALCNAIRRYAPPALEAVPLHPGIGVRLWPNSRERTVLIYDKVNYFLDTEIKHRGVLMAGTDGWTKLSLSMDFERMLEHLRKGVRIEVRLLAPYLRRLRLNRGSAWSTAGARTKYLEILSTIPLQDLPAIPQAERILSQLSGAKKTTLALWLAGRDPLEFASSRATFYRHCKSLKEEFGINMKQPAVKLPPGVSWHQISSASSIADVPSWALRSGFAFDPIEPILKHRERRKGMG